MINSMFSVLDILGFEVIVSRPRSAKNHKRGFMSDEAKDPEIEAEESETNRAIFIN